MRGTEGKVCGVLAQHVTRNGVVQYTGEGVVLGQFEGGLFVGVCEDHGSGCRRCE